METVIVLMSTFNGEKYLRTQIDSILSQKDVKIKLFVRDDGSTDSTIKILEEYKSKQLLSYYVGANLKPAKSFMELVHNAPKAAYYAFADQDDYWLQEKLICALNKLKGIKQDNKPCLYHSAQTLVDENLKILPDNKQLYRNFTSFTQSIISSQATGCTFVFNRELLLLARQYKPVFQLMHDAWMYKICLSVGGIVVFDEIPHIYYRQHERNVIGKNNSKYSIYRRRFRNLITRNCIRSKSIAELIEGYGKQMTKENLDICEKVLSYKKGWKQKLEIIKDKRIRTGNKEIDRIFILSILFGCF